MATDAGGLAVATVGDAGESMMVIVDAARSALADSAGLNPSGEYRNLKLSLIGMSPHTSQLFEFRIVDSNNFVQSRGVINPLGAADVVVNMPNAVATLGSFHLDFYADLDGSGGYNRPAANWSTISNDHSWRIEPIQDYPMTSVSPTNGVVQMTFTHNTSFTDINTYPAGTPNVSHDSGLGAIIRVMNADALSGDLIQARVTDATSGRTVGLFRQPKIVGSAFNLTIPGIVEMNGKYRIAVYVDANSNGLYDSPGNGSGDLGWRFTGTATPSGLDVTLDARTVSEAKFDVGAP